jgi:hypothetical protein
VGSTATRSYIPKHSTLHNIKSYMLDLRLSQRWWWEVPSFCSPVDVSWRFWGIRIEDTQCKQQERNKQHHYTTKTISYITNSVIDSWNTCLIIYAWIIVTGRDLIGWNSPDPFLAGARFEFQPKHWLTWMRFLMVTRVPTGQFRDSASNRASSLPTERITVHLFIILPFHGI